MNHKLFKLCLDVAKRVVEAVKNDFHRVDLNAFDVGGSTSAGSSRFSRQGTSQSKRQYTLPPDIATAIQGAYKGSTVPSSLGQAQSTGLESLITQDKAQVPGLDILELIKGIEPGDFSGVDSLDSMIARNPYSQDYENATSALYNRVFNQARAQAVSGPTNVRGGQGRQALELADLDNQQSINRFREVRGQQDKEAGVVQSAIQLFNTIESMRRGSQLGAQNQQMAGEASRGGEQLGAAAGVDRMRATNLANLHLAAEMFGSPTVATSDDLKGQGSQTQNNSNWGVGLSCCFIFLEVLNGKLPDYVRRGRDELATPNRIRGYRRLSRAIIPLMRRFSIFKHFVNIVLVKPFLIWGQHLYIKRSLVRAVLLRPVCACWLCFWSVFGWLNPRESLVGSIFEEK